MAPQEDRVFRSQEIEAALGDDLPGLEIPVAAAIERFDLVGDPVDLGDGGEHLHGLGGDLGAGAVTGNRSDLERCASHGGAVSGSE